MKFIHVADTHLGCEIPVEFKDIRKKDFVDAFRQVVDFAIKEKVDFIIHSGDFFDDYFRITSGILEEVIDLLVMLKQKDIPIIIIKGNHDIKGHRQKMINILEKLGLVILAKPNEPIYIKGVNIYGISEPANLGGEELREYYKKILPRLKFDNSGYTIFMFHGVPDVLTDEYYDPRVIPASYLPKNVDYYALGHFHIKNLYKESDKVFALPGSTERTEISRREEKSEKGFYLVQDNEIKFVKIKTREVFLLEHFIRDDDNINELVSEISKRSKESIIKLKLRYKREVYELLKRKIENLLRLGYLIIEDLYPEGEEEISLDEELEKTVFEDVLKKMIIPNKEEILELFNKIREIMEDIYSGRSTDLEKIRDLLRKELIQ